MLPRAHSWQLLILFSVVGMAAQTPCAPCAYSIACPEDGRRLTSCDDGMFDDHAPLSIAAPVPTPDGVPVDLHPSPERDRIAAPIPTRIEPSAMARRIVPSSVFREPYLRRGPPAS